MVGTQIQYYGQMLSLSGFSQEKTGPTLKLIISHIAEFHLRIEHFWHPFLLTFVRNSVGQINMNYT